uniref:Cytochrome c n=1 Tax=Roseihalotalea indica TaxID=2867963 RepID=A0AA49JJC5_9BACT|nr:cytochrome c [Tunicatimonas sp. TK19036]
MSRGLFFIALLIQVGCNSGKYQNAATENLDRADKLRYEQYMIQGHQLYKTHCSNCHQEDGTGLSQLIPPLAQSDYLLSDSARTLCIIKHGLKEKIIVNGVEYQQPMPANETLTDIEIAQIATYIYNNWGHTLGYMPVKEVSRLLNACQSN